MKLKLIAIYLAESQSEYMIACKTSFMQEFFNFDFEYLDSESDFARLHGVTVYPSFFLTKNDKVCSVITGKLSFSELKEQLLKINYVENRG
jgi:hypothetical protein